MLLGTPAAPGTGIAHRRRGSGSRAHPVTVGLRAGLTPASRLRQHPHCSPAHASEPGVTNPGLVVRMWDYGRCEAPLPGPAELAPLLCWSAVPFAPLFGPGTVVVGAG